MKPWLLLIFIVFLSLFDIHGQKLIKCTGEAQIELTDDKSRKKVNNEAEKHATINALEKAFGRVVIQGNSTLISNLNTGKKTETNSVFNMISNTSVKGEVIEVISKEFFDVKGVKYVAGKKIEVTEIKCEITIKAKEVTSPPVESKAFPLACCNVNCKKTEFKHNEDLFFYFSSPLSGYLSIFLDDGISTSRLLPYKQMPEKYESGMPIISDREYFLFSDNPEYKYFTDEQIIVDEYQLHAEKQQDMNRIFVVFSKTPLNKPGLQSANQTEILSDQEIEDGYKIPKALASEEFQRWLNKNRSYRKKDMQVEIIDITISK